MHRGTGSIFYGYVSQNSRSILGGKEPIIDRCVSCQNRVSWLYFSISHASNKTYAKRARCLAKDSQQKILDEVYSVIEYV